jgi:tetratricopeptide (TPR) repeat protein
MSVISRTLLIAGGLAAALASWTVSSAASNPAADAIVRQTQLKWEKIKFTMPTGSRQTDAIAGLNDEIDAAAARYPGNVDIQIWDGIVTSEHAGMANAFSALRLAKRARKILEKAYETDPKALDAGAPTSLGVLYYRVPGFPVAFGDKKKARALLEEAVHTAPQGMDAEYFYGDFLFNEGDYPRATAVFETALKIPPDPDRPLWDKNRRLVIEQRISQMKSKS